METIMYGSDPEAYWPFLRQSLRWEQQLHVCVWAAEYTIGEFDQTKTYIYPQDCK